jgi:hypothetical protein
MSIPDALAAFAEPPTTTVTILETTADAILNSEVWDFDIPPAFDPSILRSADFLSLSKKSQCPCRQSPIVEQKSHFFNLLPNSSGRTGINSGLPRQQHNVGRRRNML